MHQFYPATIVEKIAETPDSVCLVLSVPESAAAGFRYVQGQHLPVRIQIDGRTERRTYSICASVAEQTLRLGIRVQPRGVVSNHLAGLAVGDTLEVMPPTGQFHTALDPTQHKHYAAFVAGSGITPILSIVSTTLETEPDSVFTLFYGNRDRASTMFIEPLWALKNRFGERLSLHFIMSREPAEIELYSGRIDAPRTAALHAAFLPHRRADEVFVCGPETMIDEVSTALLELGYDKTQLHSERFRAQEGNLHPPRDPVVEPAAETGARVTVIMDGQQRNFRMRDNDETLLEAAQEHGIDLPYSCTGGVCSTCRTMLRKGEVEMAVNYALEPWEVEEGFILACQARPKSDEIVLDYDEA